MSSPTVSIFRFELGHASEAFIGQQASAMRRYRPSFWGRNLVGSPDRRFHYHLGDRFGQCAGRLFSLAPSTQYFTDRRGLRESALVHAHFAPDGAYAMALAQDVDRPLVVTLHGYDVLTRSPDLARLGGLRIRHFLRREQALREYAAKFIVVSDFLRDAALRRGYPESKLVRSYIGVDTDTFAPSTDAARDASDRPFILCVGRHVEYKAIDVLLKAFARVASLDRDVRLVQIGTGPLLDIHRRLAVELGIGDRVEFLGAQPHALIVDHMKKALAFCLPPQTTSRGAAEALGIVFCEASASACPVVSTVHGGIPEVVVHGRTGILVPEGDVDGLADGLHQLVRDAGLRGQMGRDARLRMLRHFDIRNLTSALENIYDKVRL